MCMTLPKATPKESIQSNILKNTINKLKQSSEKGTSKPYEGQKKEE